MTSSLFRISFVFEIKKCVFFVFLNSLFFVLIEQCIFTCLCFLSWLIISQDSIGLGVSSLDLIFFQIHLFVISNIHFVMMFLFWFGV